MDRQGEFYIFKFGMSTFQFFDSGLFAEKVNKYLYLCSRCVSVSGVTLHLVQSYPTFMFPNMKVNCLEKAQREIETGG